MLFLEQNLLALQCLEDRFQQLLIFSRIYFSDEEEENKKDLLLNEIDTSLRSRLIAEKENENEYRFDIYLQGDKETVFFDV